jgi:hypothetical protein
MAKTGLELLEEINEKLELLTRRFEVIEHNTKQIMNRLNLSEVKSEPKIEKVVSVAKKDGPTIAQSEQPKKEEVNQNGNTRVMGKLKKDNKMLFGVVVKILKENSLVRETKTNKAGEWQCFLTPGNYKAEYFLDNVINTNIIFTVTPEQQILRVPAPL